MSELPPLPPPPHLPPPAVPPTPPNGGYGLVQRPLQRIRGLAKALVVLLVISLPLQILGIVSNIAAVNTARQFLDNAITEDQFLEKTAQNVAALSSVLMAPIGIITIIWMYRMVSNLKAIGRQRLSWGPGWAIGGWFAPPCVYVIPWLMFKELWRASDPSVPLHDASWRDRPVSPLVTVWWVLYGILPLINVASSARTLTDLPELFDSETSARTVAQNAVDNAPITLIVGIASIAATVVYLMLVRALTDRHVALTNET